MKSDQLPVSCLLKMQRIILRKAFGDRTQELSRLFYILLQQVLHPDLSLEIGAHEAQYSQLMRLFYPELNIVACEANPLVFKHFQSRINFQDQKIVYLNKAASDCDGTASFYILDENNGLSGRNSILDRDYSHEGTRTRRITVPSLREDTALAAYGAKNAALWIDVEGAAGIVLDGLRESLRSRTLCSLYIELESHPFWKEQLLENEILERLAGTGYIPLLCDDEYLLQHNVVFVRQEDVGGDFFPVVQAVYDKAVESIFEE